MTLKLPPAWAVFVVAICFPTGVGLAFFAGWAKDANFPLALDLALGSIFGAGISGLMIWLLVQQGRALELARTGERDAIRAALGRSLHLGHDRVHLLLGSGEIDAAHEVYETHLRGKVFPASQLRGVEAALAFARVGHVAAVEAIDAVDLRIPALRVRSPLSRAKQRLDAQLLARAATVTDDLRAAERALATLDAHAADPEIAAYAAWVRARVDAPLGGHERDADCERGAVLALHVGMPTAADAVRQRAVRLRAMRAPGTYR